MRTILLFIAVLVFSLDCFSQVRVRGYTRKDGTYVQPHYRSSPNSSRLDNWSTRGNVNPYTGQAGTQNPYSFAPSYSRSVAPAMPAVAPQTRSTPDQAASRQTRKTENAPSERRGPQSMPASIPGPVLDECNIPPSLTTRQQQRRATHRRNTYGTALSPRN